MEKASNYLRDNISAALKSGMLKKEFTETHLLEIREYQLRMDKYKKETVKKIDEAFGMLIKVIKQRKELLITEVVDRFGEEVKKINSQEQRWKEKQEISQRLLNLMNESNDKELIKDSIYIMEGINKLKEILNFKEIQVYNDIDTSMTIEKNEYMQQTGNTIVLNIEDVVKIIQNYMSICEPNILEYKS